MGGIGILLVATCLRLLEVEKKHCVSELFII